MYSVQDFSQFIEYSGKRGYDLFDRGSLDIGEKMYLKLQKWFSIELFLHLKPMYRLIVQDGDKDQNLLIYVSNFI